MNRSVSLAAGIILIVLGAFIVLRGANFTSRENVLTVGDVKLTANESHTVPPWIGGVAILAGVVLLVGGARKQA